MRRLTLPLVCLALVIAPHAFADQASALAALRAACADDAQKLCAGVPSGGGRILACLRDHKSQLSDHCRQTAMQVSAQSDTTANAASGGTSATTLAPAASSPASALPPQSPAVASPTSASKPASAARPSSSAAAKSATPGSFIRLKKVQIIDPGTTQQQPQPAYTLLIPSDWTFQGTVRFGSSKGGCFSDLFGVSWEAKSDDGTTAFQGAPDYSWQYADDPAVVKKLSDPLRRQLGAGSKPCPVAQPTKAETYLRQMILPTQANATVVSTEAFPELNQVVRQRLGLSAGDGNDGSGTQTDAVRMHTAFQKDGKAVEAWLAVAVVTRVYRAGRGAFYDCHAISLVAMVAPKGKLESNDRLFKVMLSSIRPEARWQAYSSGVISKFYSAEAQKEAGQDKMISDFQKHVADTVNGVTANAYRGSINSVKGFDQNVRGVQTFRDPATGKTMELSNLYDNAWLNKNSSDNEYAMSDDPNFNPNGKLTGDWDQLQVVRPAP